MFFILAPYPRRILCAVLWLCLGAAQAARCNISPSDPQYSDYVADNAKHVPGWETVNLDLPPEERWTGIVAPKAKAIHEMIKAFKGIKGKLVDILLTTLEDVFGGIFPYFMNRLPEEYAKEIQGIEKATGISAVELFVYNIMYEFSGACTSVVAQDGDGHILHGRNLDFQPADKLRPLLMNVRFMKGGRVLFNSTSYAGYIGCLTCMKESFSITVDTRRWSALPGLIKVPGGLVKWLTGVDRSGHFLTFLTRDAFQLDSTYDQAVHRVNSSKLLGPAYVIIGGSKAGEGSIITRDAEHSLRYWSLAQQPASMPFLLETNYDHWDGKPHYRRDNGNACMAEITKQGRLSFEGIFQVLSSWPNRNYGTTYTTLMSTRERRLESYFQFCEDEAMLV